jgi:hypothetical protein
MVDQKSTQNKNALETTKSEPKIVRKFLSSSMALDHHSGDVKKANARVLTPNTYTYKKVLKDSRDGPGHFNGYVSETREGIDNLRNDERSSTIETTDHFRR